MNANLKKIRPEVTSSDDLSEFISTLYFRGLFVLNLRWRCVKVRPIQEFWYQVAAFHIPWPCRVVIVCAAKARLLVLMQFAQRNCHSSDPMRWY